MNKRSVKMALVLVVLLAIVGVGAVLNSGILYAANTASPGPVGAVSQQTDDEKGIVVVKVEREGAGAKAGLKRGDILLDVAGKPVNHCGELRQTLNTHKVGDQVGLTVLRGDNTRSLTATLGERLGQPDLAFAPCGVWGAITAVPSTVWGHGAIPSIGEGGIRILRVETGSPAEKAGLKAGDVITAVNGETLGPDKALTEALLALKPGDMVTLTVQSPGADKREVKVTLGENPNKAGQAYLGIHYASMPRIKIEAVPFQHIPRLESFIPAIPNGSAKSGVILTDVVSGGPAEKAGLRKGDYVTAIDGRSLSNPVAFAEEIARRKPGDKVKLTIGRKGEAEREVEVTLGENPNKAGEAYLGTTANGFFRIERSGDGSTERWKEVEGLFEFHVAPLDHMPELVEPFEFEVAPITPFTPEKRPGFEFKWPNPFKQDRPASKT